MLEIEARGNQPLRPGGTLPLGQSTTPYQIYDAFFDVTKAAPGWNIDTVKQSLHVLSQTIDQTYPHLSAALDGVAKFSDTIGKRDEQIKHLLAQANQVASILGDRSQQFDRLLVNAKTLMAAFNERGQAIDALLSNVSAFSTQVKGLINDNPNLQPRARAVAARQRHPGRSAKTTWPTGLTEVGRFLPSLNEAIGVGTVLQGGPAQPGSRARSAAVHRRRVQEARHRPGELLAQRRVAGIPVPRPQRHPVPQRCAAAGAAGAGGHPGSSGTGRAARIALLLHAGAGS